MVQLPCLKSDAAATAYVLGAAIIGGETSGRP
jgi:hypothetical protein